MKKITDEEIQFFDQNGYVICKGIIQHDELSCFRKDSQRLIDEILRGGAADKWCMRGPEGIPYYLTHLHHQPNDFSLRLLAHPFVGDLLTQMVGPDFVPLYESLVFKLPGIGSSVPWHRDGSTEFNDVRIFNIDIYPDRSTVDNSCVWVVPGSHRWDNDAAREMILCGRKSFQLPGAIPAELEAGDVLLHHTKVLHGSTSNRSNTLRRVVYFDNRSFSWNTRYGWHHPMVLEKRCTMYQYALHQRATKPYPSDDEQFKYVPPACAPIWNGEPVDLQCSRDETP